MEKPVTIDQVKLFFTRHHGKEYRRFDRIENPPSQRPDLCALLKIEELMPGTERLMIGAENDVIYLAPWPDELAERATEDDLVYLLRCGVTVSFRTGQFVINA